MSGTPADETGAQRRFAAAVPAPKVIRRTLSRGERFFLGPLLKALRFTFTRMFKPDMTRRYPEERMEVKPTLHGVPVLVMRDDGSPRCVACGLCEFVCPPRAIDITPSEVDRPIERQPREFVIDMLRCIECSYCEEVCPEEAIVMSTEYEVVGRRREDFVWNLKRLLKPQWELAARLEWVRRNYQRWDPDAAVAPPPEGIYRDPRWAGRERPTDHA